VEPTVANGDRDTGTSGASGCLCADGRYIPMGVLREPTFLILAAVAPMPLHGYGILQAVEGLSDGRIRLRAGTLYAALDRLVGDGSLLVDHEEVVDGRLRRYYRITDDGLEVLRRGVEQLESNAAAARGQLARRADLGLA
jgi:PadR family transcriptional regulator, regulatory protein PadR